MASWGERAGGWDQSSLTISARKFPWKAISGFQPLVHRGDSLECRCVGMHREGWAGLSLSSESPPFPQRISGMQTGDAMGPVLWSRGQADVDLHRCFIHQEYPIRHKRVSAG